MVWKSFMKSRTTFGFMNYRMHSRYSIKVFLNSVYLREVRYAVYKADNYQFYGVRGTMHFFI